MATTSVKPWTQARRHSFIVSVLRSGTRRWAPKNIAKAKAKTEKRINPLSGRVAMHYLCAECGNDFPDRQVQVDHIIPVVGPEGFTTYDDYIARMYCEEENFAVLCLECHKLKSRGERIARSSKRIKR